MTPMAKEGPWRKHWGRWEPPRIWCPGTWTNSLGTWLIQLMWELPNVISLSFWINKHYFRSLGMVYCILFLGLPQSTTWFFLAGTLYTWHMNPNISKVANHRQRIIPRIAHGNNADVQSLQLYMQNMQHVEMCWAPIEVPCRVAGPLGWWFGYRWQAG